MPISFLKYWEKIRFGGNIFFGGSLGFWREFWGLAGVLIGFIF